MLDKIELLERLAELRRIGALTEDEFSREKSSVLSSLTNAADPSLRSEPNAAQDEMAEDAPLELGGFELEDAPSNGSFRNRQVEVPPWNCGHEDARRDPLEHFRASSQSGRMIAVGALVALLAGAAIFWMMSERSTGRLAGLDHEAHNLEVAKPSVREDAPSAEQFARAFTVAERRCETSIASIARVGVRRMTGGETIGNASAMLHDALEECEIAQSELDQLTPPALAPPFDSHLSNSLDQCREGVGRAIRGLTGTLAIIDLRRDLTPQEGRALMEATPLYSKAPDEYLAPCLGGVLKSLIDGRAQFDRQGVYDLAKKTGDDADRRMNALY